MPISRFSSSDEFGDRGLENVVGRCSFCPHVSPPGHRDSVKEWFKDHMEKEHPDILKIQASTPKVKRSKKKYKYSLK